MKIRITIFTFTASNVATSPRWRLFQVLVPTLQIFLISGKVQSIDKPFLTQWDPSTRNLVNWNSLGSRFRQNLWRLHLTLYAQNVHSIYFTRYWNKQYSRIVINNAAQTVWAVRSHLQLSENLVIKCLHERVNIVQTANILVLKSNLHIRKRKICRGPSGFSIISNPSVWFKEQQQPCVVTWRIGSMISNSF